MDDARRQFLGLRAAERALLRDQMQLRLGTEDAAVETRNRFRLRRQSMAAEYELRVQHLRVFYWIDEARQAVVVTLIGRKQGNRLVIDSEEVPL